MADQQVSVFKPRPRASLVPQVGALNLTVPIRKDGKTYNIQVGINVKGIPKNVLTDDAAGRKTLEEALFEALTHDVTTQREKDDSVTNMPLFKALADVIMFKLKGPS